MEIPTQAACGSGWEALGKARTPSARPPLGSCQFLANVRQIFPRFRLYRRRSLQANTRFAAFFKTYQIIYHNLL